MLTHGDLWRAIDRLAAKRGITVSRLARQSGLDPTTFNKSKRTARGGRPRWPSTESISKILTATGISMIDFVSHVGQGDGPGAVRGLPLFGLTEVAAAGPFDGRGQTAEHVWDEIPFPALADPTAFAIEVSGSTLEPIYREGDILVVSPSASIRRGDRVVIATRFGEAAVKVLVRQTTKRIDVRSINPTQPDRSIIIQDVAWIARIVWASQ